MHICVSDDFRPFLRAKWGAFQVEIRVFYAFIHIFQNLDFRVFPLKIELKSVLGQQFCLKSKNSKLFERSELSETSRNALQKFRSNNNFATWLIFEPKIQKMSPKHNRYFPPSEGGKYRKSSFLCLYSKSAKSRLEMLPVYFWKISYFKASTT